MVRLVNLGSSFAAGPGIPPQIDYAAARSASNYAHLLAKQLNADLTDLSVSGATLLNILDTPQSIGSRSYPPQIEGIPEDADIVLVLGGGNDMAYIGGLFKEHTWFFSALTTFKRLTGSMAEQPTPADEDGIVKRYGQVLDAIHAKAPRARVIVVEYLTLLGPDLKPEVDVPFDAQRLEHHREVAAKLQRATATVVKPRSDWCELLATADLSQSHGIGSADPWVYGCGSLNMLTGKTWYHPNLEGMKAVANLLHERISRQE